jgi:hypothetical protein
MKNLRRLLFWLSLAATVAAVLRELMKPSEERHWHGSLFGVMPYDFRPPSLNRFKDAWWNPDDQRLFTPREFGVGWAVNLARALELLRGCQKQDAGEDRSTVAEPRSG